MNEITTTNTTTECTAVVADSQEFNWTREQIELVKKTICKGASDNELQLFIAQCKRNNLNPFNREIYCIPRRSKNKQTGGWIETYQTLISIDGMRLIAERSGLYEGQTPAMWCGEDGVWRDVWLSGAAPAAAKIGVYKRNFREPLYCIALWSEYCPTDYNGKPTGLWGKMPSVMLAKCAEALALRKAFPNNLSGLYSSDEMAQANTPKVREQIEAEIAAMPEDTPRPEPLMPERIDEADAEYEKMTHDMKVNECLQLMDDLNFDDERRLKAIKYYGGKNAEFVEVLTDEQLKKMRTQLRTLKTKAEKAKAETEERA